MKCSDLSTQPCPGAGRALLLLALLLSSLPLYASGRKDGTKDSGSKDSEALIVWTYDSFVSEWGPAAQIAENFKKASGREVRFVSQGDGGVLLVKAITQGERGGADIILGLDNNLLGKALEADIFLSYKPATADRILEGLALDSEFRLVPWDRGSFAFIADTSVVKNPPKSLEDLTGPEWKRKIILMDPRTSTPGLGFFAWVKAVYGDQWRAYWQRLQPSILTIASGWDSGYGMFTKGEAPLVLSYNTSPAYHLEYEETERFQAIIFAEGHVNQIEFAGILKSSPRQDLARAFMDFMLSDDFQSVIPLTNWMYPVVDTELPASFRLAPDPALILKNTGPTDAELDEWVSLFK